MCVILWQGGVGPKLGVPFSGVPASILGPPILGNYNLRFGSLLDTGFWRCRGDVDAGWGLRLCICSGAFQNSLQQLRKQPYNLNATPTP